MVGLVYRAIRPGLAFGSLLFAWAALGCGSVVAASVLWSAKDDLRVDPTVVVAGGLGTAGLFLAWAVCSDVTLAAARLLRAPRQPHPADAAAQARWAARVAAVLIGLGTGHGVAHAAPGAAAPISVVAVVGAGPVSPGNPAAPATAPDPRWGQGAGGTSPEIALVSGRAPENQPPEEVVVRRGECLWDIVARHLGPGASSADIAGEWPRWYAANRARIGSDPDLIRPGIRLHIPQARS